MSANSLTHCSRLSLALILLLGVSLQNTPERIQAYATADTGLEFLVTNGSVMVEFGFLITVSDIGAFRSRFRADELRQIDRRRARTVGKIFNTVTDRQSFRQAARRYTPLTDPFVHEAIVRLRRRDFHRNLIDENPNKSTRDPPSDLRQSLTIAHRENAILERYFGESLRHSRGRWLPPERAAIARRAPRDDVFLSNVSKELITRLSRNTMLLGFAALFILLFVTSIWAGRKTE